MQQIVEAARSSTACKQCRERKIKCSGTQPCRHCLRRQSACVFPDVGKKRLYSIAYVEDLKRRVSSAHHTTQGHNYSMRTLDDVARIGGESPTTQPPNNNNVGSNAHSDSPIGMTDRLALDPVMSSSSRFGSHVKNLKSTPSDSWDRSAESYTDSYSLLTELKSLSDDHSSLHWPTQEESYSLLDHVLASIGTVQHLFDPRPLGDHMSSISDLSQAEVNIRNLWDVELLLVFAIGELLRGDISDRWTLPGARYFHKAARHTPGLISLRASGIVAVEIMALSAFYLQCADCKDDAYLYAGTALRLAISSGITVVESNRQIRQSERTHRNRLAWTVYMQERRLAAATGNPFGLDDTEMEAHWPFESPGFAPATALSTSVRIARVTGNIVRDVYRRRQQTDDDFVKTIQDILDHVLDIDRKMSCEFPVDYNVEICVTSRTTATLQLMLLQASEPKDEVVTKFTDMIAAKFGFFDLDAVVSAAFVFVLAETSSSNTHHYRDNVKRALDVLGYLGTCGNRVAARKLKEVQQMCVQLDIDIQDNTADWGRGFQNDTSSHPVQRPGNELGTGAPTPQSSTLSGPIPQGDGFDNLSLSACLATCEGGFNFLELYRGDGLDTDGTIEMDWRTIESAILETEPDRDCASQEWC